MYNAEILIACDVPYSMTESAFLKIQGQWHLK